MKTAKFFLVLLLVVAVVLILALVIVWGLNLGIGKQVVTDDGDNVAAGPRIYTAKDQGEILSALQAAPTRQYTTEEQREILEALNKNKQ